MKTVRDIIEDCAEDYYPYHEYSGAYQDKNKESLDQALKELEEVILESLPESKKIEYETIRLHTGEVIKNLTDDVGGRYYNLALEDTRKAIKDLIK